MPWLIIVGAERRLPTGGRMTRAPDDAVTDRPDTKRDTATRDDLDPPDSTVDRVTSTSPPTGPVRQRGPGRDGYDDSRPPWTSDPFGATPPSGPPPADESPSRTTGQSDSPPQPGPKDPARPPAPGQQRPGPGPTGQEPSPQQFGHSYTDGLRFADLASAVKREPSSGWR